MTAVVLDASASIELLLDTPAGERIQAQVPQDSDWWVPEHYFVEVAGALRRALIKQAGPEALILGAVLVTADLKLASAPGLTIATIHP